MNRYTLLMAVFVLLLIGCISFSVAHAFFTNAANSTNNTFTAAESFGTPTPTPGGEEQVINTPTPTLTPTPTVVQPGDVVINELMWSGSSTSIADEWIELRNTTTNPINLTGWKITKALTGGTDLTISSGTIPANGFFLIANFAESSASSILNVAPDLITPSLSLANTNAQYVVKDVSSNTIDTADDGSGGPLAGSNVAPKKSMERNVIPGDGTLGTNWHTATTSVNLDALTTESATPKATND